MKRSHNGQAHRADKMLPSYPKCINSANRKGMKRRHTKKQRAFNKGLTR